MVTAVYTWFYGMPNAGICVPMDEWRGMDQPDYPRNYLNVRDNSIRHDALHRGVPADYGSKSLWPVVRCRE
jgi:hypothetical protein